MRVQRKRTKGFKLPLGAIYVGRPSPWGNPFINAELFRDWLEGRMGSRLKDKRQWILDNAHVLQNQVLACWCGLDKPCHADILIEFAEVRKAHD